MANFPTHIGIGTLASGMLATLTLAADVVSSDSERFSLSSLCFAVPGSIRSWSYGLSQG
jgi:hypothetical protein